MIWYVLGRVLHSVPVLVAVITLSFVIIHLTPGDPVRLMLGVHATTEAVAAERHSLGLDRPLGEQLLAYFGQVSQGDFGRSLVKDDQVSTIISGRILPSIDLLIYSVIVSLILTIPLAVLSAVKRNRLPDQLIRLLGMVVFAMPSFWLGLMLILLFGLKLHLLPVSGYETGPIGQLRTLALPALTVALFLTPMLIRTLRSSLLESLGSEYVEAARARGFTEARVIGRHAMPNSLVPLITILSINIGFLISGTVIVENVFQIPGLGSLLVQSVLNRDLPVIQALVLIFGVIVIATNLLADVAYAIVDPRVRLGASK